MADTVEIGGDNAKIISLSVNSSLYQFLYDGERIDRIYTNYDTIIYGSRVGEDNSRYVKSMKGNSFFITDYQYSYLNDQQFVQQYTSKDQFDNIDFQQIQDEHQTINYYYDSLGRIYSSYNVYHNSSAIAKYGGFTEDKESSTKYYYANDNMISCVAEIMYRDNKSFKLYTLVDSLYYYPEVNKSNIDIHRFSRGLFYGRPNRQLIQRRMVKNTTDNIVEVNEVFNYLLSKDGYPLKIVRKSLLYTGDSTVYTFNYKYNISRVATKLQESADIVYPNPASDIIYLKSTEKVESITLYSIDGKVLLLTHDDTGTINVQHLETGLYLLEIRSKSSIQRIPFCKL